MEVNILAVGDVVSERGLKHLERVLRDVKMDYDIFFTVVNGENASNVGITPEQAERIFNAGADVITLGNHAFRQRSIVDYLDECGYILRPWNFSPLAPGTGAGRFETEIGVIAVANMIGRCNMDYTPDNPFLQIDSVMEEMGDAVIKLVDFHAEATSEKLAFGYMMDGKLSAVWGTHTHVPTADERVLPGGTGYITDLGMTGPKESVIGIRPDLSIAKFRGEPYSAYRAAEGKCEMNGAVFTVDTDTGKCVRAIRVVR